jgi:integrase
MARPPRLERGTLCLEGRCSIQLSYGRIPFIIRHLRMILWKRFGFSPLLFYTGRMKVRQDQTRPEKRWQKTQYSNLIRNASSGTYYARFRVRGKLIWKSLKTDKVTVAHLRLGDLEEEERKKAERGQLVAKGKVHFEAALQAYRERGFRPVVARNRRDTHTLKPAALAYYEQRAKALLESWPALATTEIGKITENDCSDWAEHARKEMSATAFNHTLSLLRNTIEFGIKIGARYDNPARVVMRESETSKSLELPNSEQFAKFLTEIENGGGGVSRHCADLVRFMAFGGLRKSEAAHVTWADCDLDRKQIIVRGHPETGLKNRKPGEIRVVPMIPEMQKLLDRLRAECPDAKPTDPVMQVRECQKAMDRAAKVVGMRRITHHDLRHLFATHCIESGVDIPSVSRWLGHRDGGALAMKVYGHLRDQHSAAMARKVDFFAPPGMDLSKGDELPATAPKVGALDSNAQ